MGETKFIVGDPNKPKTVEFSLEVNNDGESITVWAQAPDGTQWALCTIEQRGIVAHGGIYPPDNLSSPGIKVNSEGYPCMTWKDRL